MMIFGSEDFDDITGFKLIFKGNHEPIDFGADTLVADFRVDHIGKINGCCPARQCFYFTTGGKHIYFIRKQIDANVFQKLIRVPDVLLVFNQVLNPGKGLDDILVRFGKCCQPVPGDPIVGYITQGYGVTVHRTSCVNALKMNPERQIEVDWIREMTERYPVKIQIRSIDRVGLLADVASTISKNGANIVKANTETREDKVVDSFFTIMIEDTEHLNRVIAVIKKVKLVQEVKRVDN